MEPRYLSLRGVARCQTPVRKRAGCVTNVEHVAHFIANWVRFPSNLDRAARQRYLVSAAPFAGETGRLVAPNPDRAARQPHLLSCLEACPIRWCPRRPWPVSDTLNQAADGEVIGGRRPAIHFPRLAA